MNIAKTQDAGNMTLVLSGRLDSGTAPKLLEALLEEIENCNQIKLDFSDIAYVSSAGLRVLIQGHKAAMAKEGAMSLCCVPKDVMDVLEMTGFDVVLNIL